MIRGKTPLRLVSGAEELTARAMSSHAQCGSLLTFFENGEYKLD
jgi:hypothetical protein